MIPISIPSLSELEKEYVNDALASTWISSTGKYLRRFESEFASQVSLSAHALAVTNGTVALHLALAALGAGPGDEVIVPSLTYIATANAVRYLGANPVFADVEADSWCMSPERIKELVGPRTVGIIAVHLYGHPADMDAINEVARRHGLWVVEDAAEAPFARYKNRATGALGDVGTFSFYGNKVLSSGEGGAVATNRDDLATKMALLRGQGMDPERRYFFPVVGYNFRMTNVAAAILVGQLERRDEILLARHRIYTAYTERLRGVEGIGLQPVKEWATLSPWLYCVTLEEPTKDRDKLMDFMTRRGVETRPFFIPLHTLPPYVGAKCGDLKVTEDLAARGLNLPTYPGMSTGDVEEVALALRDGVRG